MDDLKTWLDAQLDQKKVEPNSGLGQAISYMLNHWQPLTLFLRVPNAPLDNNICERALKKAILHRKNWSCAKNISTRGTRFRYHFIFEVIVAVHILALNFLLPV